MLGKEHFLGGIWAQPYKYTASSLRCKKSITNTGKMLRRAGRRTCRGDWDSQLCCHLVFTWVSRSLLMFGLQPLYSWVIRHFLLGNAKKVFPAGAEQKKKDTHFSHMPAEWVWCPSALLWPCWGALGSQRARPEHVIIRLQGKAKKRPVC